MDSNTIKLGKYLGVFLLVCAIFFGGFYIGRVNLNQISTSNLAKSYTLTGELKDQVNGVNVNIIWEAWSLLEQEYIKNDLDAQKMVYGAVKGLIASLDDPYTAFLTPDETKEYRKTNAGEYEGIGATLKQDDKYVAIESPIDKSPAQKAGVLAGDIILEVDKVSMVNKTVFEAVGVIRGKAGTTVVLKIFRPSTKKEFDLEIVRGSITVDNITFQALENGLVKIKINRFTDKDVASFNAMWDKVVEQVVAAKPKGIVIDLRNNPGGYVSSVEYVLGEFLPQGSVSFMEESKDGVRVEHKVNRTGRLINVPIVVLVNQGSASASEIFTGAIQDYVRGKVVGTTTVGKGVEQKILNLSDGSMMQIVFQKWLTPKGKNINKKEPISPDIVIEEAVDQDSKAVELLKK